MGWMCVQKLKVGYEYPNIGQKLTVELVGSMVIRVASTQPFNDVQCKRHRKDLSEWRSPNKGDENAKIIAIVNIRLTDHFGTGVGALCFEPRQECIR